MSCCSAEEDPATLDARVSAFVSDRSVGAVTGDRAGTLVFMHWKDVDDSVLASNPDADVLCGQDLCHQVPVVIRLNRLDD